MPSAITPRSQGALTGLIARVRHCIVLGVVTAPLAACGQQAEKPADSATAPVSQSPPVAQSLAMGGAKSVMTFFVTSRGSGNGGNLGGLMGADAHCQALAKAEGAGDHTWRAYLSASAAGDHAAVDARGRIGKGPWYNAEGELVAANVDELHGATSKISKTMAVTERLDTVNGVGDTPNVHDVLTGSRSNGTAFPPGDDLTCGNWTSSSVGRAQVGHHDRMGRGDNASSWNSAHPTRGCSQADLQTTGGDGRFYCFGID
jgi:hypothetical protein